MEEKLTVFKNCQICNDEKLDGITLYSVFICKECEQEIIHTEPSDERYQYFINKLKVINQDDRKQSFTVVNGKKSG